MLWEIFGKDLANFITIHFCTQNEIFYFNRQWKRINNYIKFAGQVEDINLLQIRKQPFDPFSIYLVCQYGTVDMLMWIRQYVMSFEITCTPRIRHRQDFNLLIQLIESGCRFGLDIYTPAARAGNLEVLQWLKKNEYPFDKYLFSEAIQSCNILILEWLKENDCPFDEFMVDAAMRTQNINILKWVQVNHCKISSRAEYTSVETGNLRVIQWAKEYCKIEKFPLAEAIFYCDVPTLKWIKQHGGENFHPILFSRAVGRGDISVLEWLYEEQCPMDISNMISRCYKIQVFKWLQSKNILTFPVVGSGDLNTLKWLYENKILILNETTFQHTVLTGNIDSIKWLYEKKCPVFKLNISLILHHNCNIHNDIRNDIQWLLDIGFVLDCHCWHYAAKAGNIQLLEVLKKLNCPFLFSLLKKTQEYSEEVSEWILSHFPEFRTGF